MSTQKKILNLLKFLLVYSIFIICWGAFVRISGSGAGCGESWPLCNDTLNPDLLTKKTFIEYFHRVTSGIFGLLVFYVCYLIYKVDSFKSVRFKLALIFCLTTISEGLIGAILVKKGLVTDNNSTLRAFVIALHLCNTFLLTSSNLFLIKEFINKPGKRYFSHFKNFLFLICLALFLFVAIFGTTAALSNTLYPSASLIEGIKADFSSNSHMYIEIRKYHPLFALLLLPLLFSYFTKYSISKKNSELKYIIVHYFFAFLTLLFLSPVWMKVTHLLLANILWLVFINTAINRVINKCRL